MFEGISPLAALRGRDAMEVAREFGGRANRNALGNTYLHFDLGEMVGQVAGLNAGGALYGVPVSIKDCFDVAGTVTTCGDRYYAQTNPVAERDSQVTGMLREAGCLITGKTHLHPLAYGLRGRMHSLGIACSRGMAVC